MAKIELREGRRLQPGPAGVVVMATCQGDDGKVRLIVGANTDTPGGLVPIHDRHAHIHSDEMVPPFLEFGHRLCTVFSHIDPVRGIVEE